MRIVIFWEGLPACGLLLNGLVAEGKHSITVYATKPTVPFSNLEKFAFFNVNFVKNGKDFIQKVNLNNYDVMVYTGWRHRDILKVARKQKSLIRIMAVDNSNKGNVRQFIGKYLFKYYYKRSCDAVIVPGISSRTLMRNFGVEKSHIWQGYYGAYSKIYFDDKRLKKKDFLFVGSLTIRKGFDNLINAFREFKRRFPGSDTKLHVIGEGNLSQLTRGMNDVVMHGFLQPEEVAEYMREHYFLIAPSRLDHWCTAVCEGAACGQYIITTTETGAYHDIVIEGLNGVSVDSVRQLSEQIENCINMSQTELDLARSVSVSISASFTEKVYASSINKIIKQHADILTN